VEPLRRRRPWWSEASLASALLAGLVPSLSARAEAAELLSVPRPAGELGAAPTDAAHDPAYEAEIEAALVEYERGNFLESREHFRLAHAARPSARTLRGLGKVEFELRHYVEARGFLGAALDSADNPLDAELRAEVERLLTRAATYIAELEVQVEPADALLELDGAPLLEGRVHSLVVGDHVIEARSPGYVTLRRPVLLRGGEQRTLDLTLVPSRSPVLDLRGPPAREGAPGAPPGMGRGAKVALLVGAAVAVLAAASVGIALAAPDQGKPQLEGGSTGLVLVNR
jgi:tetratricopeptide (TPR) repeat protein